LSGAVWSSTWTPPDTVPPALSIDSPAEGATVGESAILVKGTTDPDARLQVNGITAALGPFGAFELLVPLRPGANRVLARAIDASGNAREVSVNVTFIDPRVALEERLNETIRDLFLARADLNTTARSLAEARAQLNSTSENLSAVRDRVAVLEAQLADALRRLAAAEAAASALQSQLAVALASLNATRSDLEDAKAALAAANASRAAGENRMNDLANGSARADRAASETALALLFTLVTFLAAAVALQWFGHLRTMRLVDERLGQAGQPPIGQMPNRGPPR